MKITKDDKIDDNPFINTYNYVPEHIAEPKKVKRVLKLELLQRKITKPKKSPVQQREPTIVEDGQLLSNSELILDPIYYYTHPCTTHVDSAPYFAHGLKHAHDNYRKNLYYFYVKMDTGLISFEERITCSATIKNLLVEHDIQHYKCNNKIVIVDTSNMVVDMLCNIDPRRFKTTPLLCSKHQFEYGSLRVFRVRTCKIIQNGNVKKYYYDTSGILYTKDIDSDVEIIKKG